MQDAGRTPKRTIALMVGDRYGVGPELVSRFTASLDTSPMGGVCVVVIGDKAVLDRGRQVEGLAGDYPVCGSWDDVPDAPWCLLDRPFEAETVPVGRVSSEAGREMLAHLAFAIEAAHDRKIDGLVFGPLNKQAMLMAGHKAGDELDFFNSLLPSEHQTGEINVLGDLWTSRVTSHVPLRQVADGITFDAVTRAIELMQETLVRSGKVSPRIAVAGLNPHAGDGGAFGSEEIDIIGPAVEAARERQLRVDGPYPADTVFSRAINEPYDAVVTMYHDQGQIALKLMGLGRGVTLLAGFQLPIATPGHGTAYDLAGTGRAKVDGLAAAVALVGRLVAGADTAKTTV